MEENKKYRILGTLLYYVLRIISSTLKIEITNKYEIDMQKPHIYGFWHSKLFITPIFFRNVEKKLAMSSPTKDGELISVPLEKMGYILVRGSSDKKSISSTISLLKYLKKGYSIGTPLDGPKGPKEEPKKGLLYLSQKTSVPLVLVGISYSKKWILKKTWDKFEIPKPFSKVKIFLSEPITISDKDDLDKFIENKCNEQHNLLEKQCYRIFQKERLLDIIHNFIIYDNGRKKICRYNQFYAVKRCQKRLARNQGGIVWHTQGSGKSLTMVWLAKWILENIKTSRVLIITDREELDDQIEKIFTGVDLKIARSYSSDNLLEMLNHYDKRLMCSLIHKFGRRTGEVSDLDCEKYVEELKKTIPADFSVKDKVFVFVDECHRTNSGKLHLAMKSIMPDSVFIGFTGTPLLQVDKEHHTTADLFGGFIHTYKFDQAVEDGVVLDLRYEARNVPQEVKSKGKIDAWFETKTKGLTPKAVAVLKEKWATLHQLYSSQDRLSKIALDIIFDFGTKPRLKSGRGNALLVAGSIAEACRYYEIFQNNNYIANLYIRV